MSNQLLKTLTVLPVDSIEKVVAWYESILGFKALYFHEGDNEDEPTNYAILQREDVTFCLILDESPEQAETWTKSGTGYLYLIVADVKVEYEDLVAKDIVFTRELHTEDWGYTNINLKDPSGNSIRIEQQTKI